MLKNSSKFENSSHFSYNEYKKKVNKKGNKDVKIFVTAFFAGLLIILGLARLFAPNVEIGISSDNEISAADDENQMSASSVDDRLNSLKLEDDGKKVTDETMFSPELDEKVILPHQNKPTVGQVEAENNIEKVQQKENSVDVKPADSTTVTHTSKPQEKSQSGTGIPQQNSAQPVEKIVISRVVVGSYATEKQAEVAKSIMQDAGIGVTPVVKNIGGYYTLQVGSYTSKEKAQQMMNNLLRNNFPARVIGG